MRNNNLTKTDVIPIVNYSWKKSFDKAESNRKAIAERGWNPLNYIVLDSPELVSSETIAPVPYNTQQSQTTLTTPTIGLNFRNGFAGNCILDLL